MGAPPPPNFNGGPVGGNAGNGLAMDAASIRRRAPLPDQGEALMEEMRQGRFRKAR
jgi:polyadenylation factor subunit 2